MCTYIVLFETNRLFVAEVYRTVKELDRLLSDFVGHRTFKPYAWRTRMLHEKWDEYRNFSVKNE